MFTSCYGVLEGKSWRPSNASSFAGAVDGSFEALKQREGQNEGYTIGRVVR